jgi:predicted nuclease of predicted toxin-antitoxin system
MLRLVSDENFNGDIVRGLLLRHPALDLYRVQDVGLEEADDPTILAWAAPNNRIVVTHDQATMPDFAYDRVGAGQPMPGVFVVPDRLAVRQVIEELLLVEACSEQAEWAGLVVYLPL